MKSRVYRKTKTSYETRDYVGNTVEYETIKEAKIAIKKLIDKDDFGMLEKKKTETITIIEWETIR